VVWKAWLLVKANQGAAGIDRQSISDFETLLKDNLYKLWNRMSSGSYFPPPVRMVNIPKPDGGERTLGIPTVADRVAQMVVKLYLEPEVEPVFHEDSYGYRPGKSAIDAVGIHDKIEQRFTQCRLTLHPQKTKIVYCKDEDRTGSHEHESFDFLGFTFRARGSRNRQGKFFVNFSPAISNRAAKALRAKIRSWRIQRHNDKSVTEISRTIKSTIRGWLNYYGRFYRSALWSAFDGLNRRLLRWVQRKYKRYHYSRRARRWLRQLARHEPELFPHWGIGMLP